MRCDRGKRHSCMHCLLCQFPAVLGSLTSAKRLCHIPCIREVSSCGFSGVHASALLAKGFLQLHIGLFPTWNPKRNSDLWGDFCTHTFTKFPPVWILFHAIKCCFLEKAFLHSLHSRCSPMCKFSDVQVQLVANGILTLMTCVRFLPVWIHCCVRRLDLQQKAFWHSLHLNVFSSCEFSDASWGLTSRKRLFHTHYSQKVSPRCEFSYASGGLTSWKRHSHTRYTRKPSPRCEFSHAYWGLTYRKRLSHTHCI